jgi:hypothetical protein
MKGPEASVLEKLEKEVQRILAGICGPRYRTAMQAVQNGTEVPISVASLPAVGFRIASSTVTDAGAGMVERDVEIALSVSVNNAAAPEGSRPLFEAMQDVERAFVLEAGSARESLWEQGRVICDFSAASWKEIDLSGPGGFGVSKGTIKAFVAHPYERP